MIGMEKRQQSSAQKKFNAALVWLLKQKGRGAQADLCRKTGINSGYLSTIVNGGRASDKAAELISSHLGYRYEDMLALGRWILEGKDPEEWSPAGHGQIEWGNVEWVDEPTAADPGEFIAVPKYKARLSGGHGSLLDSDMIEANLMFRRDFLARRGDPSNMALFEVIGDSMEPFIYHGDVVLVDRSQSDIIDGKAYAFREDNTVKVKRLSRQGKIVIAASENARLYQPYPVDTDSFTLIGRVIWIGHEVK